jgi:dTDP-4-dehydrorhamnose reductase
MTTIVTGGTGGLGSVLKRLHPEFECLSHQELDVTNPVSVNDTFDKFEPEVCIHLAAETDVAGCEQDHPNAYRINTLGCRHVADACIEHSTRAIYTSTDYVFDGTTGMYKEEDPPNPINYYGLTKLLGEFEIRRVPNHLILRGTMKQDVGWKHPRVPDDMFQSILLYTQYAKILSKLIDLRTDGVIHVGDKRYSLFQFAKSRRPDVEPMKRADITTVKLPGDCSLDVSKLKSIMNVKSVIS